MRENFYKTQHQWYFTPAKSDKMYPEILGACWKCWMEEADFFSYLVGLQESEKVLEKDPF